MKLINTLSNNQENSLLCRRAVGIARVSSKEQTMGYSIASQENLIHEYAKANGLEVVKIFCFYEKAGDAKKRKHFDEVLEFMDKNNIKTLIAEKTDRLYRNVQDLSKVYAMFKDDELEVHLIKESVILNSKTHSSICFQHIINAALATNQNERLTEEAAKGLKQKAISKHYPFRAPFGYKGNKEIRKIEPNPKTKWFVQKIFELYATDSYSLSEVTKKISEMGLIRPSGKKYYKDEIYRILKNPVYYGDFIYHGIVMEGSHEPLISYELYKKCQEILAKRRSGERPAPLRQNLQNSNNFVLKELIRNEENRLFTGMYKYPKIPSKRSVEYGTLLRKSYPQKRYKVSETVIFQEIDAVFASFSWAKCSIELAQRRAQKAIQKSMYDYGYEKHKAKHRLEEITMQSDVLIDLCISGQISRQDFSRKRHKLDIEATKIREKLKDMKRKNHHLMESEVKEIVNDLMGLPRQYMAEKSKHNKVEILHKLADKIIVTSEKKITIEFKEKYTRFLNPKDKALLKVTA